ncbi:MAG: HipA-like protein, partial [Tatlockia sp.]|nr:HipA-like protein [Tatlockia sp.]
MISTPEYQVIVVTKENFELRENEDLGTKPKFWFEHEKVDYLYKQAKPGTGEDWAEKVAAELCEILGLPHAVYELAETWEGKRGVASLKFLQEKEGEALVNGNELLAAIVPNYDTSATYGASQHTIDAMLEAIGKESIKFPPAWTAPSTIKTAVDVFAGYLLLDAWIGNGDRHHENWGVIIKKMMPAATETIYLAPTYDHASSLRRELSDVKRQKRSVESYTNNCYSAFYRSIGDTKTLRTCEVFT